MSGILELAGLPAPLPAGTYTWSPFRPAVTLQLDDGWTSVNRFDDIFDVQQDVGSPDVIAVQLARPRALIGRDGAEVPAVLPREAAEILSDNTGLTILAQSASKIGGLDARVAEIENHSGAHVGVLAVGPGTLGIDTSRKLWIAFISTPDGLVTVMVGGSVAKWQDALDAADPVLESIRFPSVATGG